MPTINLGTVGFDLVFTAKLPPEAQKFLAEKHKDLDSVAAFDLTPAWGNVPSLVVTDIRRAGVNTPDHWLDSNVVYPMIDGIAFYIVPKFTNGMAMSMSMQGVNLRTGLPEENRLTDDPCQSYWSGNAPPWIDGYVPSHGQAVRQFVPLRGDRAMQFDVSDAIGIAKDHPWKDGLSAAFYMPRDPTKLQPTRLSRYSDLTLESFSPTKDYDAMRGVRSLRAEPERVGMGAGALMRQNHPDNPSVTVKDFSDEVLLRVTARMVWDDMWNEWAQKTGASPIPIRKLRELEERQRDFEARIWQQVGGKPKETNVDSLPTIG